MINLVQELMDKQPRDWMSVLEQDLKIRIVRDGSLASLKYDQIASPMSDPLVQQCRGMVVDTSTRRVVAWPYNKFWNLGEALAAPIDWSTARVQEKLDGSLMILYWHDGEWRVASSGHPTAGGSFGPSACTFRDAFWRVWRAADMALPPYRLQGTTLKFELCAHENRVVVQHAAPRIVLHGARDEDGCEIRVSELGVLCLMSGWPRVAEFAIRSADEVIAAAAALDPIQQEGFVVVDDDFRRVKIKSPRYVTLHHMRGDMTPRRAIELWQTGETGELLTHFPELGALVAPVQDQLDAIAQQAVLDFHENRARPSRKEFATAIEDRPWRHVIFRLLDHDSPTIDHAKAIMRRMTVAALEGMIGRASIPGGGRR